MNSINNRQTSSDTSAIGCNCSDCRCVECRCHSNDACNCPSDTRGG